MFTLQPLQLNNTLLHPFVVVLGFIICFAASTANAGKIYRWTDEQGRVHFSETPSREHDAETVKVKVIPSSGGSGLSTSATQQATSTTTASTPDTAETEALVTDYSEAEKAEFCTRSNNLLSQMQGNPNRRFQQDDGSYRRLTQEEISDYVAQANDGISRFCQ